MPGALKHDLGGDESFVFVRRHGEWGFRERVLMASTDDGTMQTVREASVNGAMMTHRHPLTASSPNDILATRSLSPRLHRPEVSVP